MRAVADETIKAILIGGTSHAGKSTLARSLASKLGWDYQSTDKLARHPGRPWPVGDRPVPPHVVEHYSTLPVDELMADVLHHYRQNVMPQVAKLVEAANASATGLVLEGSALWPDFVVELPLKNVLPVWLTASDDFIAGRIRNESRFLEASAAERFVIQKFIDRSLAYNQRMRAAVERLRLRLIDVEANHDVEEQLTSLLHR